MRDDDNTAERILLVITIAFVFNMIESKTVLNLTTSESVFNSEIDGSVFQSANGLFVYNNDYATVKIFL